MKKIILALIFVFSSVFSANAELKIDVVGAQKDPIPLAIPDFGGESYSTRSMGDDIRHVIISDLERSGLFAVINDNAYIQELPSMTVLPNFIDWQAINSQALIQAYVKNAANDKVRVEFRLWDVFTSSQLSGQAFTTEKDNWRRIAHIISDAIYERITGEKGYFDTRVVYIAETGPKTKKKKRLAIMDQDGENHKFLTNGESLVLTPRFSPSMQKITYLSYYNDNPRVYVLDIGTGRQEVLGDFPGMTFAPRFSPDGKKVIMSMANKGNSEIYEMDLTTKKPKRLTSHPAIDTSPSYSPDGKKITFNSDRGGKPQIYVMKSNGKNVERISFGYGRYMTPVWSPRGDYIAFTKIYKGKFYIGVIKPDGSGERLLTEGYLVEGPTWAPNGRVLMYYRENKPNKYGKGGDAKLFSIDLTGYNERQVVTPVEASDPAWSPLL